MLLELSIIPHPGNAQLSGENGRSVHRQKKLAGISCRSFLSGDWCKMISLSEIKLKLNIFQSVTLTLARLLASKIGSDGRFFEACWAECLTKLEDHFDDGLFNHMLHTNATHCYTILIFVREVTGFTTIYTGKEWCTHTLSRTRCAGIQGKGRSQDFANCL